MQGRELIRALHGGTRVYGTLVISPLPWWPAEAAKLGLDFVFIDTEHTPLDRAQVAWMCQAFKALGVAPIVRIPSPDPYLACMALDGGASGIIAPYVETAAQVQALRGAVKFRPLKGRRLQALLEGEAPEKDLAEYLDKRNADNVLIAMIESRPAIEAFDGILAVPGLDGVLIGPHDLSCNLGMPEQYRRPEFGAAVRTIITKARSAGVGAGIHFWAGIDQEIGWMSDGANLVVHSGDLSLFLEKMGDDLRLLRGETPRASRKPASRETAV